MNNYTYEWIGISQWWCRMDPSGQAAWVQAIGALLAIAVAVFIPYWQKKQEHRSKIADDRKIVMSVAANLDITLGFEAVILNFAPAGDGVIGHEFTLEQARQFMKLRPEAREALQNAIDKSHYFDERLCEEIVRLGIEATAYERSIDEVVRLNPNSSADTFFQTMQPRKNRLAERLQEVRELLKAYLPGASS
ncbi:MAG: hypothetical protein ACREYF_00260 [Gammaproteobacteria bacterium]